jgi:hypothetical protein
MKISPGPRPVAAECRQKLPGATGFPALIAPPRVLNLLNFQQRPGDVTAGKAFSSEVDTGSRKENASKQKTRAYPSRLESGGFPNGYG